MVELSEHSDADQSAEDESKLQVLDRLGHDLMRIKDKCVENKSDIESRWLRDERQYWGVQWSKPGQDGTGDAEDYQVSDTKTKAKTRTIAARISDMLFPTNDRNWSAKHSKVPTDIDGNELDEVTAEDAAKRAQDRIEDYLTQCNYPKHGREMIHDGCRIGTGVLKGPFATAETRRQARRVYQDVTDPYTGEPAMDPETGEPMREAVGIKLEIVTDTRPAVARVDPWMWFPSPARNVEECPRSCELHLYNKQQMQELRKYPGFDEDQLRRLLKKDPNHGRERDILSRRRDLLRDNTESLDNLYTMWEYHGPIDRDTLEALGMEPGDDPLESVTGEVWFCQGIVLKVELSAVIDDFRIPYYVWCYEDDEADIFGYGVPFAMRDEQLMLDTTLNSMKHNAQLIAGPQSLEFKGRVEPADRKREIKGPKHWIAKDHRLTKLEEAIQFKYIESSIQEVMPLYQLANQNADQNTMLPMMAQGEPNQPHQTLGGMAMMMNASNIVQRMAAHSWDDNITLQMIPRFFYWLLQYEPEDDIKIDLEVDARGASYLLVKEMQGQHAMMLLQIAQQDSQLQTLLDMDELYETVINFLDVPTDKLFKSDEDREAAKQSTAQAQQLQQRGQVAEVEQAEAQARASKLGNAQKQRELQQPQQQDPKVFVDLQKAQMQSSEHRAELESKIIIERMRRDTELTKLAQQQRTDLQKLQKDLATHDQDQRTKMLLAQMEQEAKERQRQTNEFLEGMKARLQMKELSQQQQNLRQGYDTFG